MASTDSKPSTSQTPSQRSRRRIQYPSADPHELLAMNRVVASDFQREKHKKDAARNWDVFYKNNADGFFKLRHWTDREFEALSQLDHRAGPNAKGKGKIVLEVGCGTGAFVYPLLERHPSVRFACFDFSKRAVDLVKSNPAYNTSSIHAFVHDLTTGTLALKEQLAAAPPEFWSSPTTSEVDVRELPERPDVISCIFVLSALPPTKQADAVRSLVSVLAPGGSLLLRDYALYDEAQLRFHALPSKGYATIPSLLSQEPSEAASDDAERGKPWYRRGDSTMTYFFTTEEINSMLQDASEADSDFKMVGECVVVERQMENRSEGWGCTRRFVQGSWKKVAVGNGP